MRRRGFSLAAMVAAAVLIASLTAATSSGSSGSVSVVVTDLGLPAGTVSGGVVAINASGALAGQGTTSTGDPSAGNGPRTVGSCSWPTQGRAVCCKYRT